MIALLPRSDVPDVAQSKKMEKLLAALNLPQVGEIRLVDPDDESYEEENDGSLFTIELNDRVYTMKVIVIYSVESTITFVGGGLSLSSC